MAGEQHNTRMIMYVHTSYCHLFRSVTTKCLTEYSGKSETLGRTIMQNKQSSH